MQPSSFAKISLAAQTGVAAVTDSWSIKYYYIAIGVATGFGLTILVINDSIAQKDVAMGSLQGAMALVAAIATSVQSTLLSFALAPYNRYLLVKEAGTETSAAAGQRGVETLVEPHQQVPTSLLSNGDIDISSSASRISQSSAVAVAVAADEDECNDIGEPLHHHHHQRKIAADTASVHMAVAEESNSFFPLSLRRRSSSFASINMSPSWSIFPDDNNTGYMKEIGAVFMQMFMFLFVIVPLAIFQIVAMGMVLLDWELAALFSALFSAPPILLIYTLLTAAVSHAIVTTTPSLSQVAGRRFVRLLLMFPWVLIVVITFYSSYVSFFTTDALHGGVAGVTVAAAGGEVSAGGLLGSMNEMKDAVGNGLSIIWNTEPINLGVIG